MKILGVLIGGLLSMGCFAACALIRIRIPNDEYWGWWLLVGAVIALATLTLASGAKLDL